MDRKTLDAYDDAAAKYCEDWLSQPTPQEIHDVVAKFFIPGGLTADMGCGSGREVAWLNGQGFQARGFDASQGLLKEARSRFPLFQFESATLPDLSEIPSGIYDNVLCETVLMHLPIEWHRPSVRNLVRILRSGGILSLSWRLGLQAEGQREGDGRLYSQVDAKGLIEEIQAFKGRVLNQSRTVSSSSGKTIERLVLQAGPRS